MNIDLNLKIPLDAEMFKQMCNKVKNLENENSHLKYIISELQNEKKCEFHVSKKPEIIDVKLMTPNLRLSGYCSIEKHDHRKHVIAKLLTKDVITFAYYISEKEYNNMPLEHGIALLGELHKNLMNEMINKALKDG